MRRQETTLCWNTYIFTSNLWNSHLFDATSIHSINKGGFPSFKNNHNSTVQKGDVTTLECIKFGDRRSIMHFRWSAEHTRHKDWKGDCRNTFHCGCSPLQTKTGSLDRQYAQFMYDGSSQESVCGAAGHSQRGTFVKIFCPCALSVHKCHQQLLHPFAESFWFSQLIPPCGCKQIVEVLAWISS